MTPIAVILSAMPTPRPTIAAEGGLGSVLDAPVDVEADVVAEVVVDPSVDAAAR